MHARAAVRELTLVGGVSPDPVPFDSIDGEPVRLFFLIVGPEASAGLHVKILSRIARLVRRETCASNCSRPPPPMTSTTSPRRRSALTTSRSLVRRAA